MLVDHWKRKTRSLRCLSENKQTAKSFDLTSTAFLIVAFLTGIAGELCMLVDHWKRKTRSLRCLSENK
ncbi:hypothetical protein ACUOFC_67655, partial [Escherichia sp. TWPC-MK]